MIVLQWLMSERPVQVFLVALVVLAIVGDAFARQTGVCGFAHPSGYAGEAEPGDRTGGW
jgi:hypothetical protein